MQAEVLDKWDPSDPRSSSRDYEPGQARSTTALRKCVDAFKAFTEAPEKLAEAKDRLREATRPEDKAKALRDYDKALKAFDEAPQKLSEARLRFYAAVDAEQQQLIASGIETLQPATTGTRQTPMRGAA